MVSKTTERKAAAAFARGASLRQFMRIFSQLALCTIAGAVCQTNSVAKNEIVEYNRDGRQGDRQTAKRTLINFVVSPSASGLLVSLSPCLLVSLSPSSGRDGLARHDCLYRRIPLFAFFHDDVPIGGQIRQLLPGARRPADDEAVNLSSVP